jgi:hypothetical protein
MYKNRAIVKFFNIGNDGLVSGSAYTNNQCLDEAINLLKVTCMKVVIKKGVPLEKGHDQDGELFRSEFPDCTADAGWKPMEKT